MKRALVLLVVFAVVIANSSVSFAYSHQQFKRGVDRIYHSPKQVSEGFRTEPEKAKFAPVGYVGGAVKGTAFMGVSIVQGIFEILTCAVASDRQQR